MQSNFSFIKCVEAFNGKEAVSIFKEDFQKTCSCDKFKLIFMDLQMPEMDGFEASAEILKLSSAVNIIALTAYTGEENKKRCESIGIKETINKPL